VKWITQGTIIAVFGKLDE